MESRNTFDDLKLHRLRYEPNVDYLYRPFYQPNMDYVYKPTDHPGLDYLYKPKDEAHFGFLYEPIPDYLIPDRPPYRQHRSTQSHPNHSHSHPHNECCKTQSGCSSVLATAQKPIANKNIECESKHSNLTADLKSVARNNAKYLKRFPFLVDNSHVEIVTDAVHQKLGAKIGLPRHRFTPVYIEKCTLFDAIISAHNRDSKCQICVLNTADTVTPGGGYLDGQPTQEASLCRHTLLYPTLDGNDLYRMNRGNKIDGSDDMIFSPNVSVFRDAFYKELIHQFRIDVISATPVDNRKCELVGGPKIMERRIRKILNLAAAKRADVLILSPFGCGELKNDPHKISEFFYRALVVEGMKDYFTQVIFAIYDDVRTFDVFRERFHE